MWIPLSAQKVYLIDFLSFNYDVFYGIKTLPLALLMTDAKRALSGDIKTWSQGHMVILGGEGGGVVTNKKNSCHQENTLYLNDLFGSKVMVKVTFFSIVGQIRGQGHVVKYFWDGQRG